MKVRVIERIDWICDGQEKAIEAGTEFEWCDEMDCQVIDGELIWIDRSEVEEV